MKRVLVFGMSNRNGGTEAVIKNVTAGIRDDKYAFDYVCDEQLDWEALSLPESKCFVVPAKRKHPLTYYRSIKELFSKHAHEYDAVWLNLNSLSNIDALRLAKDYGIPKRIAHAHNSSFLANPFQRILSELHRMSVVSESTDLVACSKEAGDFFFGQAGYSIVRNGIDIKRFSFNEEARRRIRKELSIGEDDHVIGNVGRLTSQKNQAFLIELMPELCKQNPKTKLLIVGEGELGTVLPKLSDDLGMTEKIIFVGERSDVQCLYSAMDVFALPSHFEGLPVCLIEAQASYLPCVASDSISSAAKVSDSTFFLPLQDLDEWISMLSSLSRKDYVASTILEEKYSMTSAAEDFVQILKHS